MCKAFEENWFDGLEKGIEKGTFITLCALVKGGMLKLSDAAKHMNMTEEDFNERMEKSDY